MVNRILQNWNDLTLVFQNAVLTEKLHSVELISTNLRNAIFKLYFNFLSYILAIVNKMNLEFQNEKCKINLLNSRICSLYRTILKNYIITEYLDKTPIENIDPKNPLHFLKQKFILVPKLPLHLMKSVVKWKRMN